MKIIRAKDYKDMSRKAANIISAQVIMKPNCVLGLATGGTPVGSLAGHVLVIFCTNDLQMGNLLLFCFVVFSIAYFPAKRVAGL